MNRKYWIVLLFVYPPVKNFWDVDVPHEIFFYLLHNLIGRVFIKSFIAFYPVIELLRGLNIDRSWYNFRKDLRSEQIFRFNGNASSWDMGGSTGLVDLGVLFA